MGGVDLQDQITALSPVMRGTVKGYHKIFFCLFDMCSFNSCALHKIITKKKKSFSDFGVEVAKQFLQADTARLQC
jgi:hypothetical protein